MGLGGRLGAVLAASADLTAAVARYARNRVRSRPSNERVDRPRRPQNLVGLLRTAELRSGQLFAVVAVVAVTADQEAASRPSPRQGLPSSLSMDHPAEDADARHSTYLQMRMFVQARR